MGRFIIKRVKCFIIALAIVIGALGCISMYGKKDTPIDTIGSVEKVKVVSDDIINE